MERSENIDLFDDWRSLATGVQNDIVKYESGLATR
jgi:hypothetical protein